ncbi:MAG: glycoside hydrolase family 43 protein [Dehalococcoidia bacterium]|nr:glycoside hydrolase family 43 protein [Dehalococcoidia bacterium]
MSRRGFLGRVGALAPVALVALKTLRQPSDDPTAKEGGRQRAQAPLSITPAPTGPETVLGAHAVQLQRTEPQITARITNQARSYQNPVVGENCPDPHVMNDGDRFYMVSTSHVLPAFPIRESFDLVTWRHTGAYVFTDANRPRWAGLRYFWAPELHRVGNLYVAYYTARSKATNRLCIGAATASHPLGPYTDIGRPLVSDHVTVLDPTFLEDEDGKRYLYWKADAGEGDPSGPICGQELTADGLQLIGDRYEVVQTDLPWEEHLVEGPSVMKRGQYYYLFYSGGKFNSPAYAVGVARSVSPLSGFEKHGAPVLRGGGRWRGPGHNSLVHDDGHDYIVYHAWEGDEFRDVRPGLIDHLVWDEANWPVIGEGTPREGWTPE